MSNNRFWLNTIIKQQRQACYMNFQMDPLYNPLRTRPSQMGRQMSMEAYPNRQFGLIDGLDRQVASGSVPTPTRIHCDNPDLLLTLHAYATAGQGDCYLSDHGGTRQKSEEQCRLRLTLNCDNTLARDPFKWIRLWGQLPSDWSQIKLSIDIHGYSNVWRSICTAWRVLRRSWRNYHCIALVVGTIARTIGWVYLEFPDWNPPLAEFKPSQS